MRRRKVIAFTVLIAVVCLGVGGYFSYKAERDFQETVRQLEQRKRWLERRIAWADLKRALIEEVISFKGEAGIVIKDLEMDWQFSRNEDRLIASASLVKIPIMAACFYAAEEKEIELQDRVKLKSSHKVSGSGVLKNKPSGSVYTIEELIGLMVSFSDNTATNILIDLLGFGYLNTLFAEMELENTNLARKMMYFKQRKKGMENYTTARDMACILERMYRGQIYGSAVSEKCLELLKNQKYNDRIPRKLPEGTLVAHKTGLERGVCHDVGIVFTGEGDYLICVLTRHKGDSTKSKKFIARLSSLVYEYYNQKPVTSNQRTDVNE